METRAGFGDGFALIASAAATEAALDAHAEMGRRARRLRRARRVGKVKFGLLAVTVTVSLAAAAAFAYAAWDIQQLTHNLKHTALLPPGVTEPAEPVDAYGRSPINILLIGSDTRSTAADCTLGGACVAGGSNAGANADSELIVHLSADRSNVTVLSIPRDTETRLPACAGGGRGMVNSALNYGPACQVAADILLTGIPIDHFVDFDFSGVIDLSSEVGGVPVCVSAAVQDPHSGLNIGKGTTLVRGKQALQFLRTRDAFYDGSDLGREQATHIFLSSLLRKVKSDATLTNIGEMQSIAETVTSYTTVDNGLASVTALLNLGQDFGQADSDRVTFLTMPWDQDTDTSDPSYQYRVQVDPAAYALFADIKNDTSFTTASGSGAAASASVGTTPSPTASASTKASESAAARTHPMHVDVINASGATNRYQTLVTEIFQDGFVYSSGSDATATQASTTLVYAPQEASAAAELRSDLALPASALRATGTGTTLVLTVGTDWTSGAQYSSVKASYSASAAISVPSQSYEENGADTGACVQANPGFESG